MVDGAAINPWIRRRKMLEGINSRQWLKFVLGIILPTVLAITIAVISTYLFIIPAFKESYMESKRQMIRELTNVCWSVLLQFENEERSGSMTRTEAQDAAIDAIEHLRYGDDLKDYFWISDLQPRLIMHPYAKELIGSDLSDFKDSGGKRLFMEIKRVVSEQDSGFINYIWKRKYAALQEVPKLSYVKKFEPWGWVVGTGMYLDDVQARTREISRNLMRMISITVAFTSLLLLVVVLRSLAIERKRYRAEAELRQSRIKYKTLVETAVDPIMMIHDGACLYANKSMEALLGYTAGELEAKNLGDLFGEKADDGQAGPDILEKWLHGSAGPGQREAVLMSKSGERLHLMLTLTRKDLGSQNVIVLTAKDVSGTKRMEEELDESREQYRLLTERLNIGVFRSSVGDRFRLMEMNLITAQLFGFTDETTLIGTDLLDFIEEDPSIERMAERLLRDGVIRERKCRLKTGAENQQTVSVSLVLARNSEGQPLYCDGLVTDVSRQQKTVEERENLIVELQTSLMFLNQPIRNLLGNYISCDLNTTIQKAARIMSEAGMSAILVQSEAGVMIGIITDLVLRDRVVAEQVPAATPVYQLMSSPLIYIDDSAMIFEAVLLLQERGIKHLVVKDSNGEVKSVISNEELLDMHRYSSAFMIEQIRQAASVEEIIASHHRLPRIVKALTDSGSHAANITRVITTISDTVLGRLIDLAIEEIGEPPARFAFISVGSEGRGEQTLVTDQDNAIIFEDVSARTSEDVHRYFNEFGTRVCTWLDMVGYAFCSGKVMAMNPKWCQPIAQWEEYFSSWIADSSPEALMEVSIFFDFRCLYGDGRLTDQLRRHIKNKAEKQKAFLYQMAQNTLLFKVPVDFFGKLAVESGGEHPNTFNIKHVMAQIVGFARVYAIYCALETTNTLNRIDHLLEKDVLNKSAHEEIVEAYNYLMQLRFRHQVKRIDDGETPDNHVNANELTHMEKDMLEKIFGQINQLRKRLSLVGHNEIYF